MAKQIIGGGTSFIVFKGGAMSDNKKESSENGGRLLLVLGVIAFIVAVALIFLTLSAFRVSSAPINHSQGPNGHEKPVPSKCPESKTGC